MNKYDETIIMSWYKKFDFSDIEFMTLEILKKNEAIKNEEIIKVPLNDNKFDDIL